MKLLASKIVVLLYFLCFINYKSNYNENSFAMSTYLYSSYGIENSKFILMCVCCVYHEELDLLDFLFPQTHANIHLSYSTMMYMLYRIEENKKFSMIWFSYTKATKEKEVSLNLFYLHILTCPEVGTEIFYSDDSI